MHAKDNIVIIYAVGIIALVISLFIDQKLVIKSLDFRFALMDSIMKFVTSSWTVIIFAAIMFLILLKKKKALILGISALSSFAIGSALQILIARPRPSIDSLVSISAYSMPSTHAITLFAMLPILHKEYPKYLWLWLGIMILITFSRFYSGVHYVSDLIMGAMLGYLIGLAVLWLNKKYRFGAF